ncbi:MAG: pimeloyl-ACP methyl ester carboxylesterase [Candidatus Azotimanducaceae bacterium]
MYRNIKIRINGRGRYLIKNRLIEEIDEASLAKPPPLRNTLSEVPRTILELGSLVAILPALAMLPKGDGHPVLVLPGFMAGDESTYVLRQYLNLMGYKALPWNLGRNTGKPEILETQLLERFEEISKKYKGKISLIGQSLGGVFARELARSQSKKIKQVITLGSPFSVGQSSSVNSLVTKLFENQSGMTITAMRERLGVSDHEKAPPVPMTAIFSKGDGVVNWRACREIESGAKIQNIEVRGSHCGMAFNPTIYYIIRNRLSQVEDAWEKYQCPSQYQLATS